MNKTVTANISGLIFNIDEEAYALLKDYLRRVEQIFSSSEGGADIMADIEGRIAEMFSESISSRKEVISKIDVEQMISVMGQPEDFMDDEMREEAKGQHSSGYQEYHEDFEDEAGPKRFYRDPDSRILGGVCSGMGHYFGVDPIIFRLLFVIAVLLGFSGILVYIIFWIVTPKARTRAEKLQMKGKKVNLDNIRQSVKKEAQNVKKNFGNIEKEVDEWADTQSGRRIGNFFHSVVAFIGSVFLNIFKFIGNFLGVCLIIIGVLLILSLSLSLVGLSNFNGFFAVHGQSFHVSLADFTHMFLGSGLLGTVLQLGVALTIGLPLLFLVLVGFKIVLKNIRYGKVLAMSMLGAWIFGIVLLVGGGSFLLSDFSKSDSVKQELALSPTLADTLFVNINSNLLPLDARETYPNDFFNLIKLEDDKVYLSNVKFNVIESKNDSIYITVIKSARGNTSKDAQLLAENIGFSYSITDNEIELDPLYSFSTKDKWRNQMVSVNLAIPMGKTVYLGEKTGWIIYDIKNVTNTHDSQMPGKYWTMTPSGLECMHCHFLKKNSQGVNRSKDINSMTRRELKREMARINREIELTELRYKRKVDKKRAELDLQISRYQRKLSSTDNTDRKTQYNAKIEDLKSEFQIQKMELDGQMMEDLEHLKESLNEIQNALNASTDEAQSDPNPISHNQETVESNSDQNLYSTLSFPNPFVFL